MPNRSRHEQRGQATSFSDHFRFWHDQEREQHFHSPTRRIAVEAKETKEGSQPSDQEKHMWWIDVDSA
jgi:hypothetical protein